MKKPTLYYSDESFKALVKRVKEAGEVPGSTARRMVETMKYDRWLHEQTKKDLDTFKEFVTEVFGIIYGEGQAPEDYGQALEDIRSINEVAIINVAK